MLVTTAALSLLAYGLVGYPALLALTSASALRSRPNPRSEAKAGRPGDQPRVDVVVCACNEARVIGDRLVNLAALDSASASLQLHVLVDGSTDGTAEAARRTAAEIELPVTVFEHPERRGKAAAVESLRGQTHGDFVLFTDANALFSTDLLRTLLPHFEDATVGSVTGARDVVPTGRLGRWARRYEDLLLQLESRAGSASGAAGEILMMRRGLWGSLSPHETNEDFALAMAVVRQGHRHIFSPRARASEVAEVSDLHGLKRRARIHAGRLRALTRLESWQGLGPAMGWRILSHKGIRLFYPLAGVAIALDPVGPSLLRLFTGLGLVCMGVAGSLGWPRPLATAAQWFFGGLVGLVWGALPGKIPWSREPRQPSAS